MKIPAGFFTLAAGLACFVLLLPLMAPGVAMEDTGELTAAAGCLGVTHPPGYQWHTLAGRLAMLVPVGTPAFRIGLAGAAAAAAAAAALFSLTRLLAGFPAAVFACAVFMLSRTLLWQAGLAEKYAPAAFLFAAAFHVLVRVARPGGPGYLAPAGAFLSGLALSHHWTALPLLVPLAFFLRPWKGSPARPVLLAFWFILPIMLRVFLVPVLSSSDPLLDWGNPESFPGLVKYLGASSYRANAVLSLGVLGSAGRFLERLLFFPVRENPALILCVPGFFMLRRTQAGLFRVLVLTAVCAVLSGFMAGLPETVPGGERYYIGLVFLLSVAAGAGAASLRGAGWPVRAAIVLAAAWGAVRAIPPANGSRSYFAADLAANLRASVPPGSVVTAYSYRWFAPLVHERVINSAPMAVVFGPAMRTVVNERAFSAAVGKLLGPLEPPVDRAAFVARVAGKLPGGLFHTYEKAPLVLPAMRGKWAGMLMKAGGDGTGVKAEPLKLLRRLRYRSFVNVRQGYEAAAAEYAARIIETQVRLRPSDPDAVGCGRLAVRMAPGQADVLEALGLAFEKSGDPASAAEVYAFAARMAPGFMDPHLGFARLTAATGQGDEYFGALMRAVEAARPWDEPVRLRAARLAAAGKPGPAIAELSAAIAAELSGRGWIYLEQGRAAEAFRLFSAALEFDGKNPASLTGLGRIAAIEEEWETSGKRFREARDGWARMAGLGKPGERLAAEAAEGLDRAARAKSGAARLASLEAAVRSGDRGAAALMALGDAALDLGRREWAVALFRRATQEAPRDPEAWNRWGMALAASGDLKGAARALRRALDTGGPSVPVLVNLGRLYAWMGHLRAARRIASMASEISPDDPGAAALSAELGE